MIKLNKVQRYVSMNAANDIADLGGDRAQFSASAAKEIFSRGLELDAPGTF